MRNRYKVTSPWRADHDPDNRYTYVDDDLVAHELQVQVADIVDVQTGHSYSEGAYRVVLDGKPVVRGKGGSVPFYGETAWCSAERLFHDQRFALSRSCAAW